MAAMIPTAWFRWASFPAASASQGLVDAVLALCVAVATSAFFLWRVSHGRKRGPPLPPGPRGLPLIGVLPFMEPQLHRLFAAWARRYGPVASFRLGTRLCVLVSSAGALEEVLRHHDVPFADRDVPAAAMPISFGGNDLVFVPYGPVWRTMRKVCVQEVLSRRNLEAVSWLRRRVVGALVRDVRRSSGETMDLGERVFVMSLDMVTNMLWGSTMEEGVDPHAVGKEFREVVFRMNKEFNKVNVSDLFPALARFDLQGIERRIGVNMVWYERVVDKIISPRLAAARSGGARGDTASSKDFLDVMLDIVRRGENTGESPFTMNNVKATLLDMVVAGSETSSTTVEWAMAELLSNTWALKRVREEIELVVGRDKTVEESHLDKLQYLAAVVKETMRLHPPLPLVFPRSPSQSCTVGGYNIPKGARVFVNAWAIHRDPSVWEDPDVFKPDRFISATETEASSWKSSSYIPFGFGRRICVGMNLGEKMVIYTLASLLHSFDWKTKDGKEVDLSDKFGTTLRTAKPLLLVPTPRLGDDSVYT